jgi:hypothetical protein
MALMAQVWGRNWAALDRLADEVKEGFVTGSLKFT